MRQTKLFQFVFLLLFCSTNLFGQNGAFYQNNLVYLPDGGGVNYESIITINGFPGAIISSPMDMAQFCVTMEHSYIGDIEMWLECPNGSQVTLINSYSGVGDAIPGGVSGGGTYLGDPVDDSGGGPVGEGWEYCFSSEFNNWGDWPSETTNTIPAPNFGNSGPSLNPNGIYLAESPFSNLFGCPVDGDWKIFVRDNLMIDDGHIFGWGMNVSPTLLGHSGFIFQDYNENCTKDTLEGAIENMIVTINPGNYVAQTDFTGGWYINNIPIGTYTVTVDTSTTWTPTCSPTSTFTVTDPNVFVQSADIGMKNVNACADPNVSIFTPVARPCSTAVVSVQVQNAYTATDIIPNAFVDIELDPILTLTSASVPYTFIGNNTYSFDLGDLFPGQTENFDIQTVVDCQAIIGQTLCNEAHLFPINPCFMDTIIGDTTIIDPLNGLPEPCLLPWDQSNLYIDGWCQNDTAYFVITNSGDDMDCYSPVTVYLDSNLVFMDSVLIPAGQTQTYAFPANGQTWVVNVSQHPLHPGNSNPSAFVELCGFNINWIPNIPNLFPLDDSDPVVDIYCIPVSASYDPNDKNGYPLGTTIEHYISAGDQMEYVVRFQNTGTDTAFTVIIRDTLDPQLNLFTFTPGIASHPYTFSMHGQSVMEWTFNNILLPDSTTNEPGSHGYITFTVDQVPNLPVGSVIHNDADIYFDSNPPIITNETWHTIYEGFIYLLNTEELDKDESNISVYPNPANSKITIAVAQELVGEEFIIYDGMGRVVKQGEIGNLETIVNFSALDSGYYTIRIGDSNTNTIKLVKK